MNDLKGKKKFYLLNTTLGNMSIKTSRSSRIINLSIYKTSAKSFDKISSTVLLVKFDETSVGSIIESVFFHILSFNLDNNRSLKTSFTGEILSFKMSPLMTRRLVFSDF